MTILSAFCIFFFPSQFLHLNISIKRAGGVVLLGIYYEPFELSDLHIGQMVEMSKVLGDKASDSDGNVRFYAIKALQ